MPNIVKLHELIDQWAAEERAVEATDNIGVTEAVEAEVVPERILPEGKRAVRTKSSGDRVYCLDEVKKTRQWITNPDILKGLGFEASDVQDVEDDELLKYQMGPALYKLDQ